jgi:hypothetical protein
MPLTAFARAARRRSSSVATDSDVRHAGGVERELRVGAHVDEAGHARLRPAAVLANGVRDPLVLIAGGAYRIRTCDFHRVRMALYR